MSRYIFHARVTDARIVRDEQKFDIGNRLYVMTLPAGNYETETGDDDLVRVVRIGDDRRKPEFVAALPPGDYTSEDDESGTHIYREPDGEPVRTPILGPTADAGSEAAAGRAALRSLNNGNTKFWANQK